MKKKTPAKSPSHNKLRHIGIVVRDIDKAVERLESLGIGPFGPVSFPPGAEGIFLGDKLLDAEPKMLNTKIGEVELELFEPVEGESPWKEFLDSRGEGIHHIAFDVDDIDGMLAKLTEQGASITLTARMQGRLAAAYVDLGIGGFIVEPMQF
jgi:catechol 2,3-dioxygenase-like lactoylglutathione lyase family enzyme